MEYIHRYAWFCANGPIPAGVLVCHRCDIPGCYEVSHLFLGTALQNQQDMTAKARGRRGEANGKSKLGESEVLEIRSLARRGIPHVVIADMFAVQPPAIWKIVQHRTWSHL